MLMLRLANRFLYLPLASPHTPVAPTKDWLGKSGLNYYADFVMQTDHSLGLILAELDRLGIADNTLVVLTSDNGCSPQADFPSYFPRVIIRVTFSVAIKQISLKVAITFPLLFAGPQW